MSNKKAPYTTEAFKRIYSEPVQLKKAPYVAKVGRDYVIGLQQFYATATELAADGDLMFLFRLTPKQARELLAQLQVVVEPAKVSAPTKPGCTCGDCQMAEGIAVKRRSTAPAKEKNK